MDLREITFKDMDLIRLAQAMAQWRSLIDKIWNHRSP
jgi:hypothetical protein